MKFRSLLAHEIHWRFLHLFTALFLGGCGPGDAGAGAPAATPVPVADALAMPADYKLVWADEFSINGLPDGSHWAYDTGMNKAGWYNHEKQYYSGARVENAKTLDGKLVITARKEAMVNAADWGGQAYTSARLITRGKAEWTYGYFEIRAKLPCGKGTWPAIWMLGSQGEWPANGELDIMEQVGSDPTKVFSTVHTTSGSGGNGVGGATQSPDACAAFHSYQMHWTDKQISFGIDGKAHATYVNQAKGVSQWPFDAPQFLILNIAIGGDLGGPVDDSIFPVQMEVDYVRIYQKP
jgi:beta-glucanase (GH16 family)